MTELSARRGYNINIHSSDLSGLRRSSTCGGLCWELRCDVQGAVGLELTLNSTALKCQSLLIHRCFSSSKYNSNL